MNPVSKALTSYEVLDLLIEKMNIVIESLNEHENILNPPEQ
jgi:hypothetical protein